MAAPKKNEKKKTVSKNTAPKKSEKPADPKTKKRFIDDDEDEDDFDGSFEDLDYGHLEHFDEEDDF